LQTLQTEVVGTVLVVDRSMAYPDSPADLYERRRLAVTAVGRRLGPAISDYVTYAEVARGASMEEAYGAEFEYVYGANLAHALAVARRAIAHGTIDRIVLVTYSLPSAHYTESGDVFFFPGRPPLPHTLAATTTEIRACAAEGIRVDTVLILRAATEADELPEPEPEPEPEPDSDPSAPRRLTMRFVEPTVPRQRDLIDFYGDLATTTGGTTLPVRPDDDVTTAIESLFSEPGF
jgi:hypothetical protein